MSWIMSFFEMTDGGINQFHLTYYNTLTFKTFTGLPPNFALISIVRRI